MSFRKFFALLFVVSLAVFLFFQFYPKLTDSAIIPPSDKKTQMHQKPGMPSISIETEFSSNDSFILIASLITSILSFSGFLISSYFSYKGHRRDEELFGLQSERERLEMDKLQAEINALRAETKTP
ncbi:MAG: hypothetical protein K0U38_02085 [Epsilonproteobacteria bacterium]|nr:hypothetical protein [Campylobacterota bacterium]